MSNPVNFLERDTTRIDEDVKYAIQVAEAQRRIIDGFGLDLSSLRMIEIGPGIDFGPALILASLGASVTLADRFLSEWQEAYHREFYRRLADAWPGPVGQVLAAVEGGYEATSLIRLPEAGENLASVPSHSMDFVYSNAVLEHVFDFAAVALEFARITRPGGYGSHQIDLRDHRSFDRPLEHLLMPEQQFHVVAEDCHFDFGNRWRSTEFEAAFMQAGFSIISQDRQAVKPDYFEDALPRLRRARSCYRHWPESDLRNIGTQFKVQAHPAEAADRYVESGNNAADLIRALKTSTLAQVDQEPLEFSEGHLEFEIDASQLNGPDGFMWTVSVNDLPEGDTLLGPGAPAILLEDGAPLGPDRSDHGSIRDKGRGRFSHWRKDLVFSTSDGSSPRDNGRRYVLLVPGAVEGNIPAVKREMANRNIDVRALEARTAAVEAAAAARIAAMQQEADHARMEAQRAHKEAELTRLAAEERVLDIYRSSSWRLTAPLRQAARMTQRLLRRG